MSASTKTLPVSAFTRKNVDILNDSLQVSNYQADSIISCQVSGLVSFDWDRSNKFPVPTLETSAGKIALPQTGMMKQTYRFDPPYTGLIEISLLYKNVYGEQNQNMAEFFNFQVLA